LECVDSPTIVLGLYLLNIISYFIVGLLGGTREESHSEALVMSCMWNQSSGKSSVLESIVGRDFLPRGSGTMRVHFSFSFQTRKNIQFELKTKIAIYVRFICYFSGARNCDKAASRTSVA
jgi:hypothetical protein